MRLNGKKALVTGSTSNLGKAIALHFAREGAHVIVSGRDETRGNEVVETIRKSGGKADFIAADLNGKASAEALATTALAKLGQVDILVNNAGIFPASTTLTATEAEFDQVFGVNVKAAFFLTAALVPQMLERKAGVVLNLGSWVVRLAVPAAPIYQASKGALETLTRAWSAEFGARGVRVNAISPGVTGHESSNFMMHGTPAGTSGVAEDIAKAAVYLSSEESSFVHGTVLDVDGGRTAVAVFKS